MPKGALIAQGKTAEIFEWGGNRVIKLYREWCPDTWAQYEVAAMRAVLKAGLPVPKVDDVIRLENRPGIIMEHVSGPTMIRSFTRKPWRLDYYAQMLAELHVQVNSCRVPELQSQHLRLEREIQTSKKLPPIQKSTALKLLSQLPESDTVCHDDLHMMNVILSIRGPIIIDWTGAAKGHPLSDIARTWLLIVHAKNPTPAVFDFMIDPARRSFYDAYLRHYSKNYTVSSRALEQWKIPVVSASFAEDTTFEHPRLLQLLQSLSSGLN
jgi:uncharacterized protein (TIGR02172 family)